jgi:cytochrome c5
MNHKIIVASLFVLAAGLCIAAIVSIVGCQSNPPSQASGAAHTGPTTNPNWLAARSEKGGAELWAETCSRCHNIRPPDYYSDAQWQTIVLHMRLRADLTGEEARKIEEFLKAAN